MGNQRNPYLIFLRASIMLMTLTCLNLSGEAQVVNPEHDNLADKFEAGKIESVLMKAEKLMDNDKYKKTPEPYLWASICYLELHRTEDPKIQAYYKNALKNAQKYAAKAVGKDKEGNFIRENWEFIEDLKNESLELADAQLEDENYRKANYTFKQLTRIDPADDNALFLKGMMELRLNNGYEASRNISKAMIGLNLKYRDLDYQPNRQSSPMVQDQIIFYLDQLINTEQLDSARKVVFSARLFFPLDEEVNKRYEDLVN
ncbi:MAG: hypothetical protein ACI9P8_000929 [Bacteroidia bacterium]|jgi:hypothetical protein